MSRTAFRKMIAQPKRPEPSPFPPPIGAVTTSYLAMRASHPREDTITAAQEAAQRLDRAHRLLPAETYMAAQGPSQTLSGPQALYVPADIVAEMAEGAERTGAFRVAAGWREVAAEMRLGELSQ